MEEFAFRQPELVGRDEELSRLKKSLDNAIAGEGSTTFIAGEAGIGKTRIVSELIKEAEAKNVQLIQGWCLAESLEPLMPVKTALREAGLLHMISDDPPPLVVSAYLLNKAGILIAQVEREETNLDSDIFAGMLQAVGNFIQDSLSIMKGNRGGGLNSLGYGDYTILIQSVGNLSLAIVIKGTNSEFLIEDMKATLNDIGDKYDNWSGDMALAKEIQPKISWFVNSGKFDGNYIVDDPKIKQENLFDNALLGIQRESVDKSIMLFLDDLQWSDPTTLNFIHYLSRNTKHNNVLIVGTYRPEDMLASHDGKSHHLEITMQNMSRESLFSKIELNRLGFEETEMIIESTLGTSSFDESFFEKIHRESGGTPFFILEVVKLLIEDRVIEQDENEVWRLISSLEKADIPSKVYDVVKRRLDRLMSQQRELLECASVIGDEFSTNVLENTTEMRKLTLLNNLSDIEKTHKLIHYLEDKYRFDHAKIREVLYNGIGKELRMEYHRIVGDTILELHKDNQDDIVNELAYHYFEARDERAGEYLVKAGDNAKSRYANEEAIRFYTSAETMLDPEVKLQELLKLHENLGDVRVLMGKSEDAVESFRKARELTDDIRITAKFIFKTAEAHEKNSDYELSREMAEMGIDMLGDAHGPEKCKFLTIISRARLRMGKYEEAMKLLKQALEVSGGGNTKEVGMIHHTIGMVHWFRGDYDNALAEYDKALKIRKEIDDVKGRIYTINNIGVVYMETGRLEEARDYFQQGVEYEERIRNKSGLASALDNIGNSYHTSGDIEKALDYHLRGLELYEQAGDRNGIAWALSSLGYIYSDLGQTEKGIQSHLDSVEICKEIGDKHIMVYTLSGLGEACYKASKFEEAHNWIDKALTMSKEIGARREEGTSHFVRANTFRDEGKLDFSKDEFDMAREIFTEVGDTNLLNMLDFEYGIYLKITGNISMAREILVKAKEAFESTGMKGWAAKTEKTLEEL